MAYGDPLRPAAAASGAARLARAWLLLAVAALGASTLFALVLVISKAPLPGGPWASAGAFYRALVLHVALAVLVWFLAFAGVLWSRAAGDGRLGAGRAALWLAVLGTLMLPAALALPEARPHANNYVPVLDSPLFLGGLALLFAGAVLQAGAALAGPAATRAGEGSRVALGGIAMTVLAALASLVASWASLPETLARSALFEILFWSAGHILQFAYTMLAMIAWLMLARAAGLARVAPR